MMVSRIKNNVFAQHCSKVTVMLLGKGNRSVSHCPQFSGLLLNSTHPEWRTKLVIERPTAEMCLACRGAKLLCGKPKCPILTKAEGFAKNAHAFLSSDIIQGSTPPGVFVGRFGYPKVFIGPMVPALHGDTGFLDTPEMWKGKSIEEIVDYRYSLVRGCLQSKRVRRADRF